jgi:DNA-binding NarL/FixJ family response regulator
MRVLLADNQPKVRFALRALIEQRLGFQVIGEAVDASDLLAQANAACPDLVLLDWKLRGLAAVDLVPALRRVCPNAYVIALSGQSEARRAALDAGADAFISKTDSPERLLAVIDSRAFGSPSEETG